MAANREAAPSRHNKPLSGPILYRPGGSAPPQTPRADMESAPTANGGHAADREAAPSAL